MTTQNRTQEELVMKTKINQQISNDEMINNCVLDRKREWFQYEYKHFEFGDDIEDWWIVKTHLIDHTNKLNQYEGIELVEFVHYSPEYFFDVNEKDDWDVEIGVKKVWNSLPFENYESPYEVEVLEKPISLKYGNPLLLKQYKVVIENPYKVINHSTIKSLELMTPEVSKWKMESLWKGSEPQFYKDKQGV